MSRKCVFLWTVLLMLGINAVAQNADAIVGKWMDAEHGTIIEIYKKEDTYNGRIVWLKDSLDMFMQDRRDVLNENPRLRSLKVMGTNVLRGFVWDGSGAWRKGEIYYYQSGNRYNGKIYLGENGDLKLKGYYSFLFFLGKTKTWTRIKDGQLKTGR